MRSDVHAERAAAELWPSGRGSTKRKQVEGGEGREDGKDGPTIIW